MLILDVLQWDLSAVTPYSILDQILRTIQFDPIFDPAKVRLHAESYLALAATDYAFSLKSPALVAVSSLGAALRGLNPSGLESMLSSIQITTGHELVSHVHHVFKIRGHTLLLAPQLRGSPKMHKGAN